MALIIEDGSIVAGANSFVTLDFVNNYFEVRGITAWTGTDIEKEYAIISGGDYLNYNFVWNGVRVEKDQAMILPRYYLTSIDGYTIDSDEIPEVVKFAQCELALRALSNELISDVAPGGNTIKEKVDVIEIEYTPTTAKQNAYTKVEHMLRGLIVSGYGSSIIPMSLG